MKIFVTGATGFIGSHFLNQAHAAGHAVFAQRRSPKSSPRISLDRDPVWIDKSLGELEAYDFEGCGTLIHFAAHSANVPYDTLENCLQYNVIDAIKMARAAVRAGVQRMIVAGSCFEYGTSGERYEFIPVTAPLEPTASYPASKAAVSSAFRALAVEEKIELLQLRIFQVYGEGEAKERFWPSLKKKALAGEDMEMTAGKQVRDFVNVEDVAKCFVDALLRTDLVLGEPLVENLGSGEPKALEQFAKEQWKSFGAKGQLKLGAMPMRKGEVMRYVPELPLQK